MPKYKNRDGTFAMVLGIIGVAGGVIPIIGWLFLPFSLMALTLGYSELESEHFLTFNKYFNNRRATTAFILGAAVVGTRILILLIALIASILQDYSEIMSLLPPF